MATTPLAKRGNVAYSRAITVTYLLSYSVCFQNKQVWKTNNKERGIHLRQSTYAELLRDKGFVYFLITQFLGAMNDNVYRFVVSLILLENVKTGGNISLTAIIFLIPGIIFSGYAGFLADKFSKRTVLIVTKAFEVVSMLMAFVALGSGNRELMYFVLFTMASQSAFFSPAKYGIMPEIIRREALSHANGLLEMSTYVAIILGMSVAGVIMEVYEGDTFSISMILVGIAVIGVATSFGISKTTAKATKRTMRLNPFGEIAIGLKLLRGHTFLTLVIAGISFFWAVSIVFQMNLLVFSRQVLDMDFIEISMMQVVVALGIGAGSLLAGFLSDDRIEYGLIPLGLLGSAVGIFALALIPPSLAWTYAALIWSAMCIGLYIVPLYALLQDLPDKKDKGRIVATNNVFANLSMLIFAGVLWGMQELMRLTPQQIFLIWAFITAGITLLAIYWLPAFFIRLALWVFMRTIYRVRVLNEDNVPRRGPALIVCNHVSFVDALILAAVVPRFIRYLIHQRYYNIKIFQWLFKMAHAIPVESGHKKVVDRSIARAREELEKGHVVCIFAEGRITRTGNLLQFKRGFERIIEGLDVPIVPVHLDKLWDSIFSYQGGRFFWKFPRRLPVEVGVSFGEPMPSHSKAWEVRQVVQELGSQAAISMQSANDTLGLRVIQAARFRPWFFAMIDNRNESLDYGTFIAKSLLLAKYLRATYPKETVLGVMLPPSILAAIMNVAIAIAGKTSANFPYRVDQDTLEKLIAETEVNVVMTTDTFVRACGYHDLKQAHDFTDWEVPLTRSREMLAQFLVFFLPARYVQKIYGVRRAKPKDVATILWSNEPDTKLKPVALSHRSIIAPVNSFLQVFDEANTRDRIMAVIPFYVNTGLIAGLWLPLLEGMGVIYHDHAHKDIEGVGLAISNKRATIIFDSSSAYQRYYDQIRPEDFSFIRYAISAGKRLNPAFLQDFETRFGLEIFEGYGNTEMGPISMNIPTVRVPGHLQLGTKIGSAGQPLPYVSVKIVNPATLRELPNGEAGLLLVKSPFRMIGYLHDPEATERVLHDGWFNTGATALVDDEGFLFFTK